MHLLFSMVINKLKKKKKKVQKAKSKHYSEPLFFNAAVDFTHPDLFKDTVSTHPLDDPFILLHLMEITKPTTLPEQRVFDNVDEMMNNF